MKYACRAHHPTGREFLHAAAQHVNRLTLDDIPRLGLSAFFNVCRRGCLYSRWQICEVAKASNSLLCRLSVPAQRQFGVLFRHWAPRYFQG